MGTLTALLNLSQNALQTSQAAITITSNNVANANTPGYVRQIALWSESDTVSLSSSANAEEGASVKAVSQRDLVLSYQIQHQTQSESSSSTESAALTALQSVFNITSTSSVAASTTIGTDINSFFNSLAALQATPSDQSVRQAVLNAAQVLSSDFNGASKQVAQQTSSLNQQASDVIGQVNSLTAGIAALNLQIESHGPSSDAGTLEDLRQQDLTNLSTLIGFDQTRTENNGLTLTTGNGALLVSEGKSFALGSNLTAGNVDVVSAAGQSITSGLIGGSLGGILRARDLDLPLVSDMLDTLAYAIGNAVNTQNAAGITPNGVPGGPIFKLPASSATTAATISLATSDPNAIAAAGVGEGSGGSTNADALCSIANADLTGGQTGAEFYAAFLTRLGSRVSMVAEENTTQQASLKQLTTQQSAQSSVSLDEEAASLMLYERSYAAAAKVFTIVDQLMASALNLGEQTTVS